MHEQEQESVAKIQVLTLQTLAVDHDDRRMKHFDNTRANFPGAVANGAPQKMLLEFMHL
jgi:hypothetical protein